LFPRTPSQPKTDRERKFTTLASQLADTTDARSKQDEKFQDYVKEEIANLQNLIKEEARLQEREDDEIITALQTFSKKLQASIREVNKSE
jgi:hypothetical protein